MYWWQLILFPFALLFALVTRIRNLLYDFQIKKSASFDANVIVVGNLAIGGTGKTPMVDYLVRYFHQKGWKVSTLSRGYGRKTHGFRLATAEDNASTIGDEPFMYKTKYGDQVPVAVGEERDLALAELIGLEPDTHVVILDDAFQHRRLVPSVAMMLTTFEHPFYEDYVLPSGRLREARAGAQRADVVIMTQCSEYMSEADRVRIRFEVGKYTDAKVYFMTTVYEELKPFFGQGDLQRNVVGISGIANPQPFERYLKQNFGVRLTHHYRDHYRYRDSDIRDIVRELNADTSLVTTEKDMVKLRQFQALSKYSCFYLPIRMKFLKDEALFISDMESKLKNYADESN